jgi:hypothetical protein
MRNTHSRGKDAKFCEERPVKVLRRKMRIPCS